MAAEGMSGLKMEDDPEVFHNTSSAEFLERYELGDTIGVGGAYPGPRRSHPPSPLLGSH
jgi:hypothetical protein